MSIRWSIDLFGGLRVRDEASATETGSVVEKFRTYKTAALLAFLALSKGPQRREELCTLLWPDAIPEAARNSLSAALSALRRDFGPDLLIADRNTVGLVAGSSTTDIATFDAAIREKNTALAVQLYRGALLPGFDEDFFVAKAREYEEKARTLFATRLSEIEREAGWDALRTLARQASTLFGPEHTYFGALLRAQYGDGDFDAALRTFEDWQKWADLEDESIPQATLEFVQRIRREKSNHIATITVHAAPPLAPSTPEATLELPTTTSVAGAALPPPWTRFFGREDEMHLLTQWLANGEKLITLTGAGGSGKTRLAIETLRAQAEAWNHRLYYIPLASLWDADLLFSAIRDALGIVASADVPPLEQIAQALRGQQCILLLDNFEQLAINGAAQLQQLRVALTGMVFVVTSRALLNLPGEREFAVSPLPTPLQYADTHEVSAAASTALFCDRSHLILNGENSSSIGALCRRLDGIPLALELAAARARVLSPTQILERLDKRPDFLQGRELGLPERHRTLRATIEWSTDLLEPRLRDFYARLAVFRDGWTLEAAEKVCAPGICEEWDVVDFLQQLRTSSLISVHDGAAGPRYRLLEMLREWGESQLSYDELFALKTRHYDFYTELAESALDPVSLAQRATELEAENGNFRAALRFSLLREDTAGNNDAARLVGALGGLWEARALNAEGREWAERALQKEEPVEPRWKARLLCCAGTMLWYCGNFHRAQALLEEGLALYRTLGDERGEALALDFLGKVFVVLGRCEDTRIYGEQAMAIARRTGDIARLLSTLVTAGWGCHNTGRPAQAVEYFDECLALSHQLGEWRLAAACEATKGFSLLLDGRRAESMAQCDHALASLDERAGPWALAFARGTIGITDIRNGNIDRARDLLPDVTRRFYGISTRWEVASLLVECGHLAIELADFERAALLLGAAQELRDRVGYVLLPCLMQEHTHYLTRLEAALPAELKATLWQRGRSLPLEEAVELVGGLQHPPALVEQA
jgi:predicted ATPase/DNA-binding SARP family transcriptional activator